MTVSAGKTTGVNIRTNPKELPVGALGAQHREERDERLVTGLDEQKSERVIVECNSLEGLGDGGKDGSASN